MGLLMSCLGLSAKAPEAVERILVCRDEADRVAADGVWRGYYQG